jgi:hypothetical protein
MSVLKQEITQAAQIAVLTETLRRAKRALLAVPQYWTYSVSDNAGAMERLATIDAIEEVIENNSCKPIDINPK